MDSRLRQRAVAGTQGDSLEARAVLRSAGIEQVRQRAGYIPPETADRIEPGEPDERPVCNDDALSYLYSMMDGHYRSLLYEWMREVIQRRERVSGELIPVLLNTGKDTRQMRRFVRRIIGKRGLWLHDVASNRDWKWLWYTTRSLAMPAGVRDAQVRMCSHLESYDKFTEPEKTFKWIAKHDYTWGPNLIDCFLKGVNRYFERGDHRGDKAVMDALVTCAVNIPLSEVHRLVAVMRHPYTQAAPNQDIWQRGLSDICLLLDYREKMLRAIHGDGRQYDEPA